MKYNKSEIMKSAWARYKMAQKWTTAARWPFSRCLSVAWEEAKEAIRVAEKIMHTCYKVVDGVSICMSRGVIAESGTMGWILSGKTYSVRKEIKRMGFRFDGEARSWYTDDPEVAEYFA